MLKTITNKQEIASSQKVLQQCIQNYLTNMGEHNVGFRGGNHHGQLWANERIWFTTAKITGEADPVTGKKDTTPPLLERLRTRRRNCQKLFHEYHG